MFKIGDRIVHPMHGAGFIEGKEQQSIGGVLREYYNISLLGGKIRLKFPVENSGTVRLRELIDFSRAEAVLNHFESFHIDMDSPWNKRYKENMERLKNGKPEDVAEVVKALMMRDKLVGLSIGDRQVMVMSKNILCSELSLVMNVEIEEVLKTLQNIIEKEVG